jgi:hypothetical protein
MDINMRVGDIEFRQMPERQPEIIHWKKDSTGKEYCYTLMFFEKDKEGFYVILVGGRPLQYENSMSLWGLMNYAQRVLDAAFDLQRDMTQPTALFLADILEDAGKPADIAEKAAAAKLRRLNAVNQELGVALYRIISYCHTLENRLMEADGEHPALQEAKEAYAKVEGQV